MHMMTRHLVIEVEQLNVFEGNGGDCLSQVANRYYVAITYLDSLRTSIRDNKVTLCLSKSPLAFNSYSERSKIPGIVELLEKAVVGNDERENQESDTDMSDEDNNT